MSGIDKFHRRQIDFGPLQYFEPVAEEPPGNQVRIRDGWLKIEGGMVYQSEQLTVGFNVVPTANHVRWDLVWVDFTGAVQITQGVNHLSSVAQFTGAPQPIPYCYPLAYVFINEAGAVIVTEADITDIRPKLNFLFNSDFSNKYCIDDGDKPDVAMGKLSAEQEFHQVYSGKSIHGKGSFTPQYSLYTSPQYAVTNGQHLTEGAGRLDKEAERIKTFCGKASISETLPDYSSETAHYFIGANDPLRVAIGKVDAGLNTVEQAANLAGQIGWFAQAAPPAGWLEMDASTLIMNTYVDLYTAIGSVFGLGATTVCTFDFTSNLVLAGGHGLVDDTRIELATDNTLPTGLFSNVTYFVVNANVNDFQVALTEGGAPVPFSTNGVGNHVFSSQFKIPEARGEFLRGWDHGRGIDIGRVFGSAQAEAFAAHTHGIGVTAISLFAAANVFGSNIGRQGTAATDSAGGTETRPRNVALLPCIKY